MQSLERGRDTHTTCMTLTGGHSLFCCWHGLDLTHARALCACAASGAWHARLRKGRKGRKGTLFPEGRGSGTFAFGSGTLPCPICFFLASPYDLMSRLFLCLGLGRRAGSLCIVSLGTPSPGKDAHFPLHQRSIIAFAPKPPVHHEGGHTIGPGNSRWKSRETFQASLPSLVLKICLSLGGYCHCPLPSAVP